LRKPLAEALGSLLLATAVIGSGIMAERLSGGNAAVALLANTAATVLALGVLISLLGGISGAHFNPAVTLVEKLRGNLNAPTALLYAGAQVAGCCAGALLAHVMFDLPLLQAATHARSGPGQWIAEFVATFGLVLIVLGARQDRQPAWLIAAWIGAAYWFTSSTSFANPAISIARSLTDTFAGIRPVDVPAFIAAQTIGATAALVVARWMFGRTART
jgi:glycerol uptake facilitator-like aquaporin